MIENGGIRIEFYNHSILYSSLYSKIISCEKCKIGTIPDNVQMLGICFSIEAEYCSEYCFYEEQIMKHKNSCVKVTFLNESYIALKQTTYFNGCELIDIPDGATKVVFCFAAEDEQCRRCFYI